MDAAEAAAASVLAEEDEDENPPKRAAADEQKGGIDQLPATPLSEEAIDSAVEAAFEASEDPSRGEAVLPSYPAVAHSQADSAVLPVAQSTAIPSEQLHSAMEEISEALATDSSPVSQSAPANAPSEARQTGTTEDLPTDDALPVSFQAPVDASWTASQGQSSANLVNGSALPQSPAISTSLEQQELATLRAEVCSHTSF